MAKYNFSGGGNSFFVAHGVDNPGPLKGNLLYINPGEFGYRNADGSLTYAYGTEFAYDPQSGTFTGGTIVHVRHFDASGLYIDDIHDVSVTAQDYQAALENGTLGQLLLAGDDTLTAVYLKSGPGSDLNGHGGDDSIYGSQMSDTLDGGTGNDHLAGRRGGDTLRGGAGDDKLNGNQGKDVISGGSGSDIIHGGPTGNDVLTGGADADVFVFRLILEGPNGKGGSRWNHDTVTDFDVGVDRLDLHTPANSVITYENDIDGNATITVDGADSITLSGIDATKVALDDLLV